MHPSSRVGSHTSGISGSSEGGRIDTMRLKDSLGIYGVALAERLRKGGFKGKLNITPAIVDGLWGFRVEYEGETLVGVPELWYGRRVVLERTFPPPASPKQP